MTVGGFTSTRRLEFGLLIATASSTGEKQGLTTAHVYSKFGCRSATLQSWSVFAEVVIKALIVRGFVVVGIGFFASFLCMFLWILFETLSLFVSTVSNNLLSINAIATVAAL